MSKDKLYYSMEEAVNKISEKFNLGFKDANDMNEAEFSKTTEEICKYVEFVEHSDYIQFVPKVIKTGELILL